MNREYALEAFTAIENGNLDEINLSNEEALELASASLAIMFSRAMHSRTGYKSPLLVDRIKELYPGSEVSPLLLLQADAEYSLYAPSKSIIALSLHALNGGSNG